MALNTFAPIRAQFVSGETTPRAHLEATFAAIEALEPTLHAFVHLCKESALAAADASTARYQAGHPLSALDGCPIGIKDIIETRDAPTQMNSPIFADWHSGRDAACVHALRESGALVVGKTHTTEFAIGRSSPATNPHDPRRTPGGSSSGSASAVGGGLLPIALGTQTAGSILRPASFCGAYGYKPSYGMLSVAGIHPLSHSLDTLGTIAASLEDAWRGVYEIWNWTGSSDSRLRLSQADLPRAGLRKRRLAWLRTDGWADLDNDTIQGFNLQISRLRAAGVEIVDAHSDAVVAEVEKSLEKVGELNNLIVQAEVRYPIALYYEKDKSKLGQRLQSMVEAGATMTGSDRAELLKRRDAIREAVRALEPSIDGFVSLASTGPAPIGLEYTGDRTFLSPWSVVGGPAFSLPLLEVDGMPVGLQLMGFYGQDDALASVAGWVEGELA